MTTETMTVHQALSTLKILDDRIQNQIRGTTFITTNKHSNDKIAGKPVGDYKDGMKSDYESIIARINRRAAIRNALSISNAQTKVTIGGKSYTVAEAIEMKKTGMENLRLLVKQMTVQFAAATLDFKRTNGDELQAKADAYVSGLFANSEKAKSDEAIKTREAYIEMNFLDMVDPLDIKAKVEQLSEQIDAFDAEIDAALSVSNALTTITVSYDTK